MYYRICHVYSPPQVDQVGLFVSKEVDKELVLEGGEGDLDGGPGQVANHLSRSSRSRYLDQPGQVARVVEGRRLVDLLLGLVAALLLHCGLRLLPVPLLRLLMRLGGLGKLLRLVYLDQVGHGVDGRHGGQGDNQQFIIGLDCLQSCNRLEKEERPNNRKQRHHPKTRLTVWGRWWSRAVHQRRPPGTSR